MNEENNELKNNFKKKYLPALKLAKAGAIIWIIFSVLLLLSTLLLFVNVYVLSNVLELRLAAFWTYGIMAIIPMVGASSLLSMIKKAIKNEEVTSQASMAAMCVLFSLIFGLVSAIPILTAEQKKD